MHDVTNRYQVFPWIKLPGCGVITRPHLALRLQISSSSASTCLLCLHRNVVGVPCLFMTVWCIYIFTAVWYQIHCRSLCTACDEWLLPIVMAGNCTVWLHIQFIWLCWLNTLSQNLSDGPSYHLWLVLFYMWRFVCTCMRYVQKVLNCRCSFPLKLYDGHITRYG